MKFSDKIINWYKQNKRNLPWRVTSNPYKIWMSEIILQQTRIDQGISYYLKFESTFEDVYALATADEQLVLKLWQGLGYYSRARNMHKTAQLIVKDFDGKFPQNYKDIISLPGIGEYTAAAISSIAFNESYPVIDGNVIRVISRIYGITKSVSSNVAKKEIAEIAGKLIDKRDPGTYNQAIMEFGALYCKPQNPDCANCIFQKECFAYKNQLVDKLPLKDKPVKQKKRYFHYLILKIRKENKPYIYINQRTEKDIWQNLYDFPMIEKEKRTSVTKMKEELKKEFYSDIHLEVKLSKEYKHVLSHQLIYARFYVLDVIDQDDIEKLQKKFQINYSQVSIDEFGDYPVPRLIEKVINECKIL